MDKIGKTETKWKYTYPLGPIRFSDEIEKNLNIRLYFYEKHGIPGDKIIHGQLRINSDYKAEIVDYYNEYYIVNYIDYSGKRTQLAFKGGSLQPVNKVPLEEIKYTIKIIEE